MMLDPVLLVESGHSYERTALETWFKHQNTDPVTNIRLSSKNVSSNHTLRKLIVQWKENHPSPAKVLRAGDSASSPWVRPQQAQASPTRPARRPAAAAAAAADLGGTSSTSAASPLLRAAAASPAAHGPSPRPPSPHLEHPRWHAASAPVRSEKVGLRRIFIVKGDILACGASAVVHSTNPSLAATEAGTMAGSLIERCGPALTTEIARIALSKPGGRLCATGRAVATSAPNIAGAFVVIHTAPPPHLVDVQVQSQALASCYTACLELARDYDVATVAFPAIATGALGYDKVAAARVAVSTLSAFDLWCPGVRVALVSEDDETLAALRAALQQVC